MSARLGTSGNSKLKRLSMPPFFKSSQHKNEALDFHMKEAIELISANRNKIPDRYWDGDRLNIAQDEVSLERQKDMVTTYTMEGKTGDRCKLEVKSENYADIHECGGKEFGELIFQIRLDNSEAKKLKELYILTKDDVTLADLLHCDNMEIRRDAIKKLGYEAVKQHATIIDRHEKYDLLDLRFGGEDFGRFLKMEDSTSTEVYLLQVPRTRDFGTVKIQMNSAAEAVAWSFKKQKHQYHPDMET